MADHNWQVFVDWSGRNALSPISRRSLRARREIMQRKTADWAEAVPDGCMYVGDASDTIGLLIVGTVFLAILLTAVGPFLVGLALLAVEVTIVLVIAAFALLARTLLGRPWRVVAVSDAGELWSWRQTGWGNARELEGRIHRELGAGAHPSAIAPGTAIAEGQAELIGEVDDALIDRNWVRIFARGLFATLVVIAIVLLVRGLTSDDEPINADGDWELVQMTFDGDANVRPLTLRIRDGRASGQDGCNQFSEHEDGAIVRTQRGCSDRALEIAKAVNEGVFDGRRTLEDGRLVFTTDDVELVYRRWTLD